MKRSDVLKLSSMPAASPSYPLPPFRFVDREYMIVAYESDPDAIRAAGFVAAAPPELRGAAMGLYSLVGFGGGMLGPTAFGIALDAAGGASSASAWIWAYAAIGAGCLAAPLAVRLAARGALRRP